MFKGSLIPIVTPFKDGKIDKEGLQNLIQFHIKSGTDGIIHVELPGNQPPSPIKNMRN